MTQPSLQILQRLSKCPIFANVLQSGKKDYYSYVVMTLLGASLDTLIGWVSYTARRYQNQQICIGKPAIDHELIHIFDFGLARQYVIFPAHGRPKLRRPRARARFRGTLRYCSINAQERGEQGRPDDLWNLLYMLTEMRGKLPWDKFDSDAEILWCKRRTPPELLLHNCPVQFLHVFTHLTALNYYIRPNYSFIYNTFECIRKKGNIRFSDPYDWEFEHVLQSYTEDHKAKLKVISPDGSLVTPSTASHPASIGSRGPVRLFPDFHTYFPLSTSAKKERFQEADINPFPAEFFSTNPLVLDDEQLSLYLQHVSMSLQRTSNALYSKVKLLTL
ncbi:hypothetical protein COOONC_09383 [Cooperia oncophora]